MLEQFFTSFATEKDCLKRKAIFNDLSLCMIHNNHTWEDIKKENYSKDYLRDELQVLAFNWQTFKTSADKEDHKKKLIAYLVKNDLNVYAIKKEDYSCCFPAQDFRVLTFQLSEAKKNVPSA